MLLLVGEDEPDIRRSGIYAPCAPYFKYFEEAESKYGVPAIFFAAFAMQESVSYGLQECVQD
jgi:hypothetical protein